MTEDLDQPEPCDRPAIKRWVATADLVFAAGTVVAAVAWLWRQDGEAALAMGALMLPWVFLTAAAFALAHRALTRNWKTQWGWQIPGPALLVLMLFGTMWAVGSALVAALAGWFVLRKDDHVAGRSDR